MPEVLHNRCCQRCACTQWQWLCWVAPSRHRGRGRIPLFFSGFGLPHVIAANSNRVVALRLVMALAGTCLLQLEGMALKHMQAAVHDPELRKQLTPSYTIGCKRMLFSDDYYPALTAPNVKLVPAGLKQVGTLYHEALPLKVSGGPGSKQPQATTKCSSLSRQRQNALPEVVTLYCVEFLSVPPGVVGTPWLVPDSRVQGTGLEGAKSMCAPECVRVLPGGGVMPRGVSWLPCAAALHCPA